MFEQINNQSINQ